MCASLKPVTDKIKVQDEDAGVHTAQVKSQERMCTKIHEYMTENKPFPRAACIQDLVRLSVAFDNARHIMEAFEILKNEEGFELVRHKNKYHPDLDMIFRNLMVNVIVTVSPDGKNQFPVIGELQLTTIDSVKVKKTQHKYYEIMRAFEGRQDENGKIDTKSAYKALIDDLSRSAKQADGVT